MSTAGVPIPTIRVLLALTKRNVQTRPRSMFSVYSYIMLVVAIAPMKRASLRSSSPKQVGKNSLNE